MQLDVVGMLSHQCVGYWKVPIWKGVEGSKFNLRDAIPHADK